MVEEKTTERTESAVKAEKPAVKPAAPAQAQGGKGEMGALVGVVLVRGLVGIRVDIKKALATLKLGRKHACTLHTDSVALRGQLRKAKDYVAYGTITAATRKTLEEKRGAGPVWHLHPPRGGWERKGTKKSFQEGGALGNRGERMNELIARML